ncbi:F-box/kelch-repeat protein At1g80440-like [Impatiens glandulifera]|uniref:F-box/kelch-repeat protein At1g80440-like n=1 Tax=Impatiens glandulifera TaxID=253017 RepID=UPI001FB0604B|nr:F-box/kelch-repeat protein At1g80440-like [Impatiens glandulifera]
MRTIIKELIPGLPNELAVECLMRIPADGFAVSSTVCKAWKAEIEKPEFRRRRKVAGLSRCLLVLVQAWVDPSLNPGSTKLWGSAPIYRLTLCDPESGGNWSDLPPLPWFPAGLPMFCQVIGVGSDLVVLGGCDPETWQVYNSVFIYNLVSGEWRCGSDMPGQQRLFFAVASDSERMIYVAGGHDEEKNALKSALAYDVANDKWEMLPDMAREREEGKGIFLRGKFQVIGGYITNKQGEFESDSESFDVATQKWDSVRKDFLESASCPSNCVVDGGDDNDMVYMCKNGEVTCLEGSSWVVRDRVPDDVARVAYVTAWQGKLFVIGSAEENGPHNAYQMDIKSLTWTKIEAPGFYKGHVQSGCCLLI